MLCILLASEVNAQTYTWNRTGSASWAVSTNWTPSRVTPSTNDILVFSSGATLTATDVPTQTVRELRVTNGTTVTLRSAGTGTVTLTVASTTSTSLDVASGATLILNGSTLRVGLSPAGTTAIIGGTLDMRGNRMTGVGAITINGTLSTTRTPGFSGSTTTALASSLSSITLGSASTIIYARNTTASTQNITARNDYANLAFTSASVKVLPSATVSVRGNFTVSGGAVTVPVGNTMQFNGTGAQNIAGIAYSNITFAGGNTKTLTSAATVSNLVSFANNTTLASGGNLTLLSNATSTGRIGPVTDASQITGNINMQRIVPSAGRHWYHLASPVSNATISQLMSGAPTTGVYITGAFAGASNPGNGIVSTGVSMYRYDASTGAYAAYPSSTGDPVTNGVGYRLFIRDGDAAYNGGVTTAKTLTMSGPVTFGNKSFSLSYSAVGGTPAGGWNLLGNPYPSDITANLNNASAWDRSASNITNTAVYIWDSNTNQYLSCNGGVGTCTIPSSQAFWVQTSAPGTLVVREAAKSNSSTTIYRTSSVSQNYYGLIMGNVANPTIVDRLYVRYDHDATLGYDAEFDAYELSVSGPGALSSTFVSAVRNNVYYSIDTKPDFSDRDTVDLYIAATVGQHYFDFSEVSSFDNTVTIYLWDKYLNTVTDVSANPVYNFDVLSGVTASKGTRFSVVHVKQSLATPVVKSAAKGNIYAYPNPASAESELNVNGSAAGANYTMQIFSNRGEKVYEQSGLNGSVSVSVDEFPAGLYLIKVSNNAGTESFVEKVEIR